MRVLGGMRGLAWESVAAGLLLAAIPGTVSAQAGDAAAGKAVYERKCAPCHGDRGDGKGPGAERLVPKPRDFSSGIFKIRSTSSKMPSDQDLFDVINRGMPGTSMPSWRILPERDRWNLVAYVKTFAADKFKDPAKLAELPKPVASSEASIKRGKEMFDAIECNKCHGADGRGDGPSRPDLKDEWGAPIAAADLTKRWNFRGGPNAADIAMRLAVGVRGTPMPSFLDSVEKPDDIWHLANFVASLGPDSPHPASLVTVTPVAEPIPEDPTAGFWTRRSANNILLEGQVTLDPRNFNPAIDLVAVRAVYNDTEIAFHLTWDDPAQSKGDGVSLQFPPQQPSGTERPYFLLGDASNPVYLLRYLEGAGVAEVTANGPAQQTPIAGGAATGKAVFANGQYRVVIKRSLLATQPDRPSFHPEVFTPVAFQAWDAGAGEGVPKMSLTSWYYLRLEAPQSNRRFVIPPVVALLTVAAMLLVVRAARSRAR